MSPSRIDFGEVHFGSAVRRDVSIENRGDQPVSICLPLLRSDGCSEASRIEGDDASFGWPLEDMIWSLGGGQSARFNVAFSPTATGTRSAELKLGHTGAGSGAGGLFTVVLAGTGTDAGMELDSTQVDFGTPTVAESVERALVIRSTGTTTLVIERAALTSNPASVFSVIGGPPMEIPPGQSAPVRLRYASAAAGQHRGLLELRTNAVESPVGIELVGATAEAPEGACQLVARPSKVDFGSVAYGQRLVLPLELANVGTRDCTVSVPTVTGAPFSLETTPTGATTVGPHRRTHLALVYASLSSSPAPQSGQISFEVNGTGLAVDLVGITNKSSLKISPRQLDLGMAKPNCSAFGTSLRLHNDGSEPATVNRVAMAEGASDRFSFDSAQSFPTDFPGQTYLDLGVGYRPLDTDGDTAIAHVETSDGQRLAVGLWGAGVAPGPAPTVEEFVQAPHRKVDILFVVETTNTTTTERRNLGGAFEGFLNWLEQVSTPWVVDYQIAVVNTAANTYHGRLWRTARYSHIISQETANPLDAFKAFVVPEDFDGPDEPPTAKFELAGVLRSSVYALTEPMLSGDNLGFMRDDAQLSIVVLTDDEGPSPPTDMAIAADFLLHFKGHGANTTRLLALVGTDEVQPNPPDPRRGCPQSLTGFGWDAPLIKGLAASTGGASPSICADFGPSMIELAPYAAGLSRRFWLRGQPARAQDIESVRVNDVPLSPDDWTYDEDDNSILLKELPPIGSRVRVAYTLGC